MRSFVVSVIIILVCFGISTVNCIWTCNRINLLIRDTETLSADDIGNFCDRWRSAEKLLSFTSRRTYIRDIEDALQRITASLENGDEYELEAAKKALVYKMKELCRSHCFDLKSIL